uniref:Uncharacterized protein n=1 Tax=Romanomermis culicivorax TaxID=13658 RepID=A0A915K0X6_ROMCU
MYVKFTLWQKGDNKTNGKEETKDMKRSSDTSVKEWVEAMIKLERPVDFKEDIQPLPIMNIPLHKVRNCHSYVESWAEQNITALSFPTNVEERVGHQDQIKNLKTANTNQSSHSYMTIYLDLRSLLQKPEYQDVKKYLRNITIHNISKITDKVG